MAGETEFSQRVIRVIQKGDKLIRDIRKDLGEIGAAAIGVKNLITDFRKTFKDHGES
jgi:hypothetical protein